MYRTVLRKKGKRCPEDKNCASQNRNRKNGDNGIEVINIRNRNRKEENEWIQSKHFILEQKIPLNKMRIRLHEVIYY